MPSPPFILHCELLGGAESRPQGVQQAASAGVLLAACEPRHPVRLHALKQPHPLPARLGSRAAQTGLKLRARPTAVLRSVHRLRQQGALGEMGTASKQNADGASGRPFESRQTQMPSGAAARPLCCGSGPVAWRQAKAGLRRLSPILFVMAEILCVSAGTSQAPFRPYRHLRVFPTSALRCGGQQRQQGLGMKGERTARQGLLGYHTMDCICCIKYTATVMAS